MVFNFDEEIILENSRALLRPVNLTDSDNLAEIALNEKDLLLYSPNQINNKSLLVQYIENAILLRENKLRYSFTIFDKQENKFAGSTSFLNISDMDDRLEIGATFLGKAFQKTGLNRNCKFLLLDFAFKKLGAMRVEFKTDERNTASRVAIEKIGGRFEGILRQHMVMYDGFRRNTVYYSILKTEWEVLKTKFLK